MKSLIRIIPIAAVALMVFSLPIPADSHGEFICYPFICN